MSQYIAPVIKDNLECEIKGAPSIDCSYGDMLTLIDFMHWMSSIVLDERGCCMDNTRLQYELDDCLFYKNDVIEGIQEEYINNTAYAEYLIGLFNKYIEILKFSVDGEYGIRWA